MSDAETSAHRAARPRRKKAPLEALFTHQRCFVSGAAAPRPTLFAVPESYADEPDAYSDGGRKTKRRAVAAAKKTTPPHAPPEPYAADATFKRRYPSLT